MIQFGCVLNKCPVMLTGWTKIYVAGSLLSSNCPLCLGETPGSFLHLCWVLSHPTVTTCTLSSSRFLFLHVLTVVKQYFGSIFFFLTSSFLNQCFKKKKQNTQTDTTGSTKLLWEGVLPQNKQEQVGESRSSPSCMVSTRKQTSVSCCPSECPNSSLRAHFVTDSLSSCIGRAPAGNVPRKRDKQRLPVSLSPASTLTVRLRAPLGWVSPALSLPPDKCMKNLTSTLRYHSQKKQSWQFLRGRK